MAFVPLMYWPVTEAQPTLSETAVTRINAYMRNGGVILFDTRDRYQVTAPGARGGPGLQRLIEISRDLEIPPLAPVSPEHVLTRPRSEERRVGKECVSTVRSRGWRSH